MFFFKLIVSWDVFFSYISLHRKHFSGVTEASCLLISQHNCLLRLTAKNTSKLCITGPLWWRFTSDQWIPLIKGQAVPRGLETCHTNVDFSLKLQLHRRMPKFGSLTQFCWYSTEKLYEGSKGSVICKAFLCHDIIMKNDDKICYFENNSEVFHFQALPCFLQIRVSVELHCENTSFKLCLFCH